MRKKIGIAKRKAIEAESSSRAKQTIQNPNEAGPSKNTNFDATVPDKDTKDIEVILSKDLELQDFHDICQFFATGGGENSDDEEVWAALETHVRINIDGLVNNFIHVTSAYSNIVEAHRLGRNSSVTESVTLSMGLID